LKNVDIAYLKFKIIKIAIFSYIVSGWRGVLTELTTVKVTPLGEWNRDG